MATEANISLKHIPEDRRLELLGAGSARIEEELRRRFPDSEGHTCHKVDDAASAGISFRNMYRVFRGLNWGFQMNLQSDNLQELYFGVGAYTRITQATIWACISLGAVLGLAVPMLNIGGDFSVGSKLAYLVCLVIGVAAGGVLAALLLGVLRPLARLGISRAETEALFNDLRGLLDEQLRG